MAEHSKGIWNDSFAEMPMKLLTGVLGIEGVFDENIEPHLVRMQREILVEIPAGNITHSYHLRGKDDHKNKVIIDFP